MPNISQIKVNDVVYDIRDADAQTKKIPSGGSAGQFLMKASSTSYDTEWSDLPTVTPTTDTVGSAAAGTAIAADDITAWSAGTLPSATVTGEVLEISFGSLPSLSYTARTIPNISVTSKTVVTGITAS